MKLAQLRQTFAKAINDAKAIKAKAKEDDRDVTSEEVAQVTELMNEAKDLKSQIASKEETNRIMAEVDAEAELLNVPLAPLSQNIPNVDTAIAVVGEPLINKDPNRGFQTMGHFATFVLGMGDPNRAHMINDLNISSAALDGMRQSSGSDGGFLVPPTFSTLIWDGLGGEADNLLAQTDQFTVEGESLTMNANAETSRTNGNRFGGILGAWKNELAQMTASSPKVRDLKLEPQELFVLVPVSDKLIRNSPIAMEQLITRAASDEINFKIGDAIIEGNGVGQPLGILNSNHRISISAEDGQAANTIVANNILKMHARLHAKARSGAVWYINQEIEPQLSLLNIATGVAGQLVYMPAGGLSAAPFATIFGLPVVPIEYCSALGTIGDIILTNLRFYAVGLKGGIQSATSIHLKFDFAQTAFRFIFEIDGQPWMESPITPFKGNDTLSTTVVLATRS